jgi:ABC-2 type transport system permease protein
MGTLLQIEWLKVKKYKPFWFILIFLLLLAPLATIGCGEIFRSAIEQVFKENKMLMDQVPNPFDFKHVFLTSAWITNGLNIAWGMLLILMVGNEFQNKTIRQNVIDGQNRNDIITSKLFLVLIYSVISALLTILSGVIAGLIYSRTPFEFDLNILKTFGIAFAAAFMQMLFALLFAFFIKRPALSVILYLGYTVFIENIIVHLIFRGLFRFEYGRLFMTQTADELTISPLKVLAPEATDTLPIEAPWIACTIYAGLILFFLYRYINRTILK